MTIKKRPRFYLAKEGGNLIPIDGSDLKAKLLNKEISPDDLIINKFIEKWSRIKNVKGFRTIAKSLLRQNPQDEDEIKKGESELNTIESILVDRSDSKASVVFRNDQQKPSQGEAVNSPYNNMHHTAGKSVARGVPLKKIYLALLAIVFLSASISGIIMYRQFGTKEFHVTGNVTFLKDPVKEGTIRFENKSAPSQSFSGFIKDGKFDLIWEASGFSQLMLIRIEGFKEVKSKKYISKIGYIPPKYNLNSEIFETISPGDNNILIHLD